MSDIVERLRDIALNNSGFRPSESDIGWFPTQELLDAADEIKRLRAERDRWREFGQVYQWDRDRWRRIADGLHHRHRIVKFGDYGLCLKCEAQVAYRKARREEAESACGNTWCDSREIKPGKEQCSYEGSSLCAASAPCFLDGDGD